MDTEINSAWSEWADRLLKWGMMVAIPAIGLVGFILLTSIKHPRAGELATLAPPAPGTRSMLAAPELDSRLPSVQLAPPPAPKTRPCAGNARPADATPCERTPPSTVAGARPIAH